MTQIFKPIIFSTKMVEAILEERKYQTRRITVDWDQNKPKFIISSQGMYGDKYPKPSKYMAHFRYPIESTDSVGLVAPIQPDDILWVRETFANPPITSFGEKYIYKAGFDRTFSGWKPSIHMPKEAARIFLKVISVRCERLNDISEYDAIQEGVELFDTNLYKDYEFPKSSGFSNARISFASLWDSINGKESWTKNPFVWVYKFEKIGKPENFK